MEKRLWRLALAATVAWLGGCSAARPPADLPCPLCGTEGRSHQTSLRTHESVTHYHIMVCPRCTSAAVNLLLRGDPSHTCDCCKDVSRCPLCRDAPSRHSGGRGS